MQEEKTSKEEDTREESQTESTETTGSETTAETDSQSPEPDEPSKSLTDTEEDTPVAGKETNATAEASAKSIAEEAETGSSGEDAHISDEELEKEDDTEEVHSDEDHHDEHEDHHEVMPDYAEFSTEDLVSTAEKLLKSEPVQTLKKHFEGIRTNLLKQLNSEREAKLEQFLKEGGNKIDFEFIQPIREQFRKVYGEYRNRRQKHYRELEEELKNNLKIKNELIEQIKELVNKEESIGDTFKEFNKIQQEWRNTGPVPRADSGDLYRTYHHHVENFYEYIKINKELRDLDFKKNRKVKEELIEETRGLIDMDDLPTAFKKLQELHRKWKNTGPVEREQREPLWQTFSDLTHQLHNKREEYYSQLREKAGEMVEIKKQLISKLKEIPEQYDAHHKWQNAMKKVDEVAGEFKKIGRVNHPENDAVWDEFRSVIRNFNHAKNQFYKGLKKQHHENLKKKQALLEKAEQLKNSDDWRAATNEFKRIQAEWKRIGHVPRSESDKIWKQFRGACNHFFDRLTENNKERDKSLLKNLEAKKAIIDKLDKMELKPGSQKESVEALKKVISEWKDAGQVPRNESKVEKDFNKLLDAKFKAIDLDRKESQKIRFENKMDSISTQGGVNELHRERDQIKRQITDGQKELAQLETNLSFFSSSNPKNPFIKEAEKNIQRQREQIELLQEKLKMLNVRIRGIQKAAEQGKEEESGEEEK